MNTVVVPHTAAPVPLLAGDVGLSHGRDAIDGLIRFAEARRYGKDSPEAAWNHAFLVVDSGGAIIEAQGRGVVDATLAEYASIDHAIYRPPYPEGPAGGVRAAQAMAAMRGQRYGYLTIACEALALLTQTRLRFGVAGEHICSGAVSRALALGGLDMGDDEEWNTPADIMHIVVRQGWRLVSR